MIIVREREVSIQSSSTLKLNFVLPACEAMPQPPLSALLGQAQINATEFCKLFNSISGESYYNGVLLNVSVLKLSDNSLKVVINGIFLPFLFFQASNLSRKKIYIETLFDLFQVFKLSKPTMSAREFFGVLRTSRFKIRFLLCFLLQLHFFLLRFSLIVILF
jgi:hypothetical protein